MMADTPQLVNLTVTWTELTLSLSLRPLNIMFITQVIIRVIDSALTRIRA